MSAAAPRRVVLAALLCLLTLAPAGCAKVVEPTDITSDLDRTRAATLAAEPLFSGAIGPVTVLPGRVHSEKLGWDRTEVTADLYSAVGIYAANPEWLEKFVAKTATSLRDNGWTLHWEMCLPPPRQFPETQLIKAPMGLPRVDGFEWLVAGYKVTNGVSYWVLIVAGATAIGEGSVRILMRAPNSRDPDNLIGDGPSPFPADQACAEDGKPTEAVETAGEPMQIRDWWPFPAESRSPNPLKF